MIYNTYPNRTWTVASSSSACWENGGRRVELFGLLTLIRRSLSHHLHNGPLGSPNGSPVASSRFQCFGVQNGEELRNFLQNLSKNGGHQGLRSCRRVRRRAHRLRVSKISVFPVWGFVMRGGKSFECFYFLNESSDCCSCGVGLSALFSAWIMWWGKLKYTSVSYKESMGCFEAVKGGRKVLGCFFLKSWVTVAFAAFVYLRRRRRKRCRVGVLSAWIMWRGKLEQTSRLYSVIDGLFEALKCERKVFQYFS